MTNLTHSTIIPLIGGEVIGAELAFGSPPLEIMSYEAFWSNDQHIVNYYQNEIPYRVIDKGERPEKRADVISTTCPCAGLSTMSQGYGDDNAANQWMFKVAEYVLSELKPKVLWGENAPTLVGKIGTGVREKLYRIGRSYGYSMFLYRTKTLLHGGPQVRERSFYFFFEGDRVPVFNYFNREYDKIENVILNVTSNFQTDVINSKTPSQDPYYKFILEGIHGGRSHKEHASLVEPQNARGNDAFSYIERLGYTYNQVADWMKDNGFEREVEKCHRKHEKLAAGGSIMRRGVIVPKDRIGAFVGWYPTMLTHPIEDRFINYREAMTIMGLPSNFELLNPTKNTNHICQNVPVMTAKDMADEVIATLEGKREMIDATMAVQYNNTGNYEIMEQKISSLSALFD